MSDRSKRELRCAIRELLGAFKPEELVRTEELGSKLDFSSHVSLFKDVLELFSRLEKADFRIATTNQLDSLRSATLEVENSLSEILAFDVEEIQNPPDERRKRVERLTAAYEAAKRVAGPVIAIDFAWSGGIDLDGVRQQVRSALKDIVVQADEGKLQLESQLKEADRILTAIKGKSADLGVTEHAILFQEAATEFSAEKSRWLTLVKWVAGISTLLAIGNSVWVFLAAGSGSLDIGESLQIALAKLVLFSFAYYVLVWSVRMFRAAAHNEVVNLHRFRAMRTFERFTDAASDKTTKDAVLLRSTESIFGHQSTGLSDSRTDPSGTSRLMEVVRGLPPDNQN